MGSIDASVQNCDYGARAVKSDVPDRGRGNKRGTLGQGDAGDRVFVNRAHQTAHRLQHPKRVRRNLDDEERLGAELTDHTMLEAAQGLLDRALRDSDAMSLCSDREVVMQRGLWQNGQSAQL